MLERITLSNEYLECYPDESIHHRFCDFHLFENDYYIYPKYLYNVVRINKKYTKNQFEGRNT